MNELKSSAELKAATREKMIGRLFPLIAGFFIMETTTYFITSIASSALPLNALWAYLILFLVSVIVQLLMGVFNLGQAKLYLNFVSGREINPIQVFSGFRENANKGVLIALVLQAIQLVCMLPCIGCLFLWRENQDATILGFAIILGLCGIAVYVYFSLVYSQCYYMAIDFPQFSVRQLLDSSKRVMKGNVIALLKMNLSFIPMLLAALISMGIGMIWLYPYMQGTHAHFYMNLMEVVTGRYQQ
ncbi:MAG: DUF975 family protein [Lachnospiraceae bacterium]|nr:DUF975 family protein [Candidatus Merdinaster equi]